MLGMVMLVVLTALLAMSEQIPRPTELAAQTVAAASVLHGSVVKP